MSLQRITFASCILLFFVFSTTSAMTREEALSALRRASANHAAAQPAAAAAAAAAAADAASAAGLPQKNAKCVSNDDCNGRGVCYPGYCSDDFVVTEEACQKAGKCVKNTIDIRQGHLADAVLIQNYSVSTPDECEAEGSFCVNKYIQDELKGLRTKEDCLDVNKNPYGSCVVKGRHIQEFKNNRKDCVELNGGLCFDKEEGEGGKLVKKFKSPETCRDEGYKWKPNGVFRAVMNEWLPKHIWYQPKWYPVGTCTCEDGYAGDNCELLDGDLFLDQYKEKHGAKAFALDGVVYRILKYGNKGAPKVPASGRVPVEVVYTEKLAQDGSVVFATDVTADRPTTVVNLMFAKPGWKTIMEQMREGDRIEAVLPPDVYYGAEGRGKICPTCTVVVDVELVKVREDLMVPSFRFDVQHLGEATDEAADLPTLAFDVFRDDAADKNGIIAMFYSPNCGHSKSFMPVFAAASLKNKALIPFTAVDCLAHPQVCRENSIEGYPTIKYIKDAKKGMKFNYRRDEAGMNKFIEALIKGREIKVSGGRKLNEQGDAEAQGLDAGTRGLQGQGREEVGEEEEKKKKKKKKKKLKKKQKKREES